MTLGGHVRMPIVFATAVATALAIVWLGFGPAFAIGALPASALALLMFARLCAAAYSPVIAGVVCASLFAQPDLAPLLLRPDGPVWLSLIVFALAASGADAVKQPGVRPIVALGAALAVLQAVDPIGVFIVAAIIPVLVALPQLRTNGMQAVTLAILVLFIPLVTSVLLAGTPAMALPAMLTALGLRGAVVPAAISPFALVSAVGLAVPFLLLPLIARTSRSAASIFAAMLALLIIAAFAAAAILGTKREAYWLTAALIPVTAVIAATLKPAPSRERLVIMASLLSLGCSWAAWSV
jgi:hypothetical protein